MNELRINSSEEKKLSPSAPKLTLMDVANEWIESYHKDEIKRQSYVKYRCIINNYIKDTIGGEDIRELKRRDIQNYINSLRKLEGNRIKRPLSPSTVNETLTVLKLVFGYAFDFELISELPTDRVKGAKQKDPEVVRCFTIEEQAKIEKYIYSKFNTEWYGIILTLYTGLRIGELLALEWSDVDFKTGVLSVTKTLYVSKDENGVWREMVDTPKTKSSKRVIPLPAHVLRELRALKKTSKSSRIVSKVDGSNMQARLLRFRFQKMLKELGIRELNFHTLRHTFATRALENRVDIKTLADILGHSNPSITLSVYTHSMTEQKQKAMKLMKPIVDQKKLQEEAAQMEADLAQSAQPGAAQTV